MKKKTKKVLYNVQCAFDKGHIFEKVFEVEISRENHSYEMEAFCPFCNKRVSITVKGKAALTESRLRNIPMV